MSFNYSLDSTIYTQVPSTFVFLRKFALENKILIILINKNAKKSWLDEQQTRENNLPLILAHAYVAVQLVQCQLIAIKVSLQLTKSKFPSLLRI